MKKKYLFAILPIVIGLGCWLAYAIIGTSVAADGTLIEPFGLLPIGWLLNVSGFILGFVFVVIAVVKKRRK